MINYSDENILNKVVFKCLTFDPFSKDLAYSKYLKNKTDYNIDLHLKYYSCANECFDLYDNLPVYNYHYELSCLCIKNCHDLLNDKYQ